MPCGVWKVHDVPTNEVGAVMQEFRDEGAEVVKEAQPDGLWTVIATFEPCPEDEPEGEAQPQNESAPEAESGPHGAGSGPDEPPSAGTHSSGGGPNE